MPQEEGRDQTTKVLIWLTVAVIIFFEVMTAFFRTWVGNYEQLSSLRPLYKSSGPRAVMKACAGPPVQRFWVYTACRIEQRPEGIFLILATYPDFNMAKQMAEVGFRLRSTIPLSDL